VHKANEINGLWGVFYGRSLRHDLGYSTDYAFRRGDGGIPSVFPGLCRCQFIGAYVETAERQICAMLAHLSREAHMASTGVS